MRRSKAKELSRPTQPPDGADVAFGIWCWFFGELWDLESEGEEHPGLTAHAGKRVLTDEARARLEPPTRALIERCNTRLVELDVSRDASGHGKNRAEAISHDREKLRASAVEP